MNGPTSPRGATLGILACLALLVANGLAETPTQTIDQRFTQSLRERGLYRLAEEHCQTRLDSDRLTDRERAELTLEWSLVAVSRAFDAPAHQRDRHWRQAHALLDAYLEVGESTPYWLLIDLQDALVLLQQAKLERLEQLDLATATDDVRSLLRLGIAGLRDAAGEVEHRRQQTALGQSQAVPEFTSDELDGLDRNISLALARAYRQQGLTYAIGSTDRVNALQQAIESLERIAGGTPADKIAWRARALLAESLGELGQAEEGLALFDRWTDEKPDAEATARLAAVRLHLLTDSGRMSDAREWLQHGAPPAGRSPEFDLAHLQLLLASQERDTGEIDRLLASIRANHGPSWIRQAEAQVGRSFAAEGDTTTAVGQVHAAEHFFRAGKLTEAVAAYDRAAELHRRGANRKAAFDAERTAAAIVQQQRDFSQAADRFRRLALGSLDRDDSASDHREAILCLATAAREAPRDARQPFLEAYLQACREHLRHWPASPATEEIRLWLGQSLAARQQWSRVVDLLDEVLERPTPDSPDFDRTMALLAVAYRSHGESITDATAQREWIVRATKRLQPRITGADNRWPATWSDAQRTCALQLARMRQASGKSGAAYAEQMLRAALTGSPPPSEPWRREAVPLLARVLVETGNTAEAIDLLRKESTEGAAPSLEPLVKQLVEQLSPLGERHSEQAAIGQLVLAALEIARQDVSDWQKPADRYRAAALVAVGNEPAASKLYESLLPQFPRDGDLQEEYATLLATTGDHAPALTVWTRVESASQRGGPRWLRARAARIQLLKQLGRQEESRKLEQLTRVLHPGFGQ